MKSKSSPLEASPTTTRRFKGGAPPSFFDCLYRLSSTPECWDIISCLCFNYNYNLDFDYIYIASFQSSTYCFKTRCRAYSSKKEYNPRGVSDNLYFHSKIGSNQPQNKLLYTIIIK